jgi:hypothetical protein
MARVLPSSPKWYPNSDAKSQKRLLSIFVPWSSHVYRPLCRTRNERIYIRCLVIFATRPHNNISRRGFCSKSLVVGVIAICSFLEEPEQVTSNASQITLAIGRNDTKETLTSFLCKVRLLEHTLCRVNVRQVESRSRMT